MLFNSLDFLLFFPIVVFCYYLIPNRFKHFGLLAASYYFYMSWNARYGLLILFCTACTYLCGLLIEKYRKVSESKKRIYTAVCIVLTLSVLAYFKYTGFALGTLERILNRIGIAWKTLLWILFFRLASRSSLSRQSVMLSMFTGEIFTRKKTFSGMRCLSPSFLSWSPAPSSVLEIC